MLEIGYKIWCNCYTPKTVQKSGTVFFFILLNESLLLLNLINNGDKVNSKQVKCLYKALNTENRVQVTAFQNVYLLCAFEWMKVPLSLSQNPWSK